MPHVRGGAALRPFLDVGQPWIDVENQPVNGRRDECQKVIDDERELCVPQARPTS